MWTDEQQPTKDGAPTAAEGSLLGASSKALLPISRASRELSESGATRDSDASESRGACGHEEGTGGPGKRGRAGQKLIRQYGPIACKARPAGESNQP